MQIKPKSPEQIIAGVAAFAAEQVRHQHERAALLAQASLLAALPRAPEQVVRAVAGNENPNVEGGGQTSPVTTEHVIATKAEYIDFLRRKKGDETIVARQAYLERFKAFAPVIEEDLGEELGHGGSSRASTIEYAGKQYVVRRPLYANAEEGIDNHVAAAVKVRGVPGVEQLVAVSYENGGMTVAERVPGQGIHNLDPDTIQSITNHQVEELVEAIVAISRVGVGIDTSKGDNFLYDPQKGFGIIDLYTSTADNPTHVSTEVSLSSFAKLLALMGPRIRVLKTAHEYAHEAERIKHCLPPLEAYVQACSKLPDETFAAEAKLSLGKMLDEVKETAARYADTQWVEAHLAQEAAERERVAHAPPEDDYI